MYAQLYFVLYFPYSHLSAIASAHPLQTVSSNASAIFMALNANRFPLRDLSLLHQTLTTCSSCSSSLMLYALSFGTFDYLQHVYCSLCITLSFIFIRLLISSHPILDMHSACIIRLRIWTSLDFITFTTLTFKSLSLSPLSSPGFYRTPPFTPAM